MNNKETKYPLIPHKIKTHQQKYSGSRNVLPYCIFALMVIVVGGLESAKFQEFNVPLAISFVTYVLAGITVGMVFKFWIDHMLAKVFRDVIKKIRGNILLDDKERLKVKKISQWDENNWRIPISFPKLICLVGIFGLGYYSGAYVKIVGLETFSVDALLTSGEFLGSALMLGIFVLALEKYTSLWLDYIYFFSEISDQLN